MNGINNRKPHVVHYKDKLTNLRSIKFFNLSLDVDEEATPQLSDSQQSPPPKRLGRRRSTLTVTNGVVPSLQIEDDVNPENLVKFNLTSLLTTFISIHLSNGKLLYISEVISDEMNPQFEVDLPHIAPNIHKFIVKLWCKTDKNWEMLCLYKLNLWKSVHIGNQDNDFDLFKSNTLSLQLNDQWFSYRDMLTKEANSINTKVQMRAIPSYTFDSMRRLNYLSNTLQELTISKHNLIQQIKCHIGNLQNYNNINNITIILDRLRFQVDKLTHDVSAMKASNEELSNKIYNRKQQLKDLEQMIENFNSNTKELIERKLELYNSEIQGVQQSEVALQPQLNELLKKYIQIVDFIFPITTIDSTNFSILGFQFPQDHQDLLAVCYYNNPKINLKNLYYEPRFESEFQFHNFKVNQINACLALIVQLIMTISNLTNSKLKYKMVLAGNQSYILDEISEEYPIPKKTPRNITKPFKFPLFYDARSNEKVLSGNQYMVMNQNFEYGLKLMNKNLMILIDNVQNLIIGSENIVSDVPLDCLDNFLWNLKYLELFMTA
ncbi:UV radiation resistance associated protein [Candida viswanathii]|uniref:UV radiation resistance associated protein n=1 Tax=Candida viswanathii TaxID=5486 RepID=A0A367Y346_9ASCO|nr:UV radiation resistance associated protein [Candida viswanathii]